MIQFTNVTFTYNSNQQDILILYDVSLTIAAGEWVSVVGPSGSGKTTLLKLIAGSLQPASGKIQINQTFIAGLNDAERQSFMRKQVATVYQQFRLLPQFTVLENVMLPLIPYQKRNTIRSKAVDLIEQLGLSHRLSHYPHQLSGGEQQRVSFARSLMTEPAILLCDEPTGNLDTANRDNILALLSDLHQRGQTIVLATHDGVVAKKGDRVMSIHDGVISDGELEHASV